MVSVINPYRFVTGGWDPSDESLIAWYDASDTGTITTSGSEVTQIDDKSGNGYDLTPPGTGPDSGTDTINGNNVLTFVGAEYLKNGSVSGFNDAFIFAWAGTIDSISNDLQSLFSTDSVNDFQLKAENAGYFRGRVHSTVGHVVVSDVDRDGDGIWLVTYDGTGTASMRYNGTQLGTASFSADLDDVQELLLNTNRAENAEPNTKVGEFIIFDDYSTQLVSDIEDYLSTKWGI